MANPTGSKTE